MAPPPRSSSDAYSFIRVAPRRNHVPRGSVRVLALAGAISRADASRSAQQPTFTPDHANGIYAAGERIGWTATLPKDTKAPGPYTYTIRKFGAESLSAGTLVMKNGRGRIETSLAEPAMLVVEVKPPGERRELRQSEHRRPRTRPTRRRRRADEDPAVRAEARRLRRILGGEAAAARQGAHVARRHARRERRRRRRVGDREAEQRQRLARLRSARQARARGEVPRAAHDAVGQPSVSAAEVVDHRTRQGRLSRPRRRAARRARPTCRRRSTTRSPRSSSSTTPSVRPVATRATSSACTSATIAPSSTSPAAPTGTVARWS